MKKALIYFSVLTLIQVSPTKAAMEVLAWVQIGTGGVSLANLNASYGGTYPKDVLTAVACQFWAPTTGGGVSGCSDAASLNSIVSWAHANNIKVLLTVYNGGGGWDWPLAYSCFNNASTFSNALISAANAYSLDGIDLDLEGYDQPLAQEHRTEFKNFISDLSTKLKASSTRCKMLTVCTTGDVEETGAVNNVPNSDWWADWVGKVDYIHTMLYAEGGDAGREGSVPDIAGDDQYYYSTQQKIGTDGGYPASAISMAIPSFDLEYGSGWNQYWSAHLDQCYNIGASICIWDMQLTNSNWKSGTLWTSLKRFKSLTSNFSLTINKTSGGTVTTNPAGSSFAPNTQVTLTAVPSSGFKFSSWSGAVTGTGLTATVTMNGNKTVTATFASNNVGSSFDMIANGLWESYKDSFGSTITMTKSTTSVAANWNMVKNPANDWSYVGIDGSAADGSFAGLTSIIVTYTSTKPLLISLTDPLLSGTGDDYQYSLPAATTASTVTLATTDFAQPADPTTKSVLRLDSIISIAFAPDVDVDAAAASGIYTITQLKVTGTTLSATKTKKRIPQVASQSNIPLIRATASGLEIGNLHDTRLVTVYNAVGQALTTIRPGSSPSNSIHVPLGNTKGIVFVRSTGLQGTSSVQRIVR
jgi:hypothetical protein